MSINLIISKIAHFLFLSISVDFYHRKDSFFKKGNPSAFRGRRDHDLKGTLEKRHNFEHCVVFITERAIVFNQGHCWFISEKGTAFQTN